MRKHLAKQKPELHIFSIIYILNEITETLLVKYITTQITQPNYLVVTGQLHSDRLLCKITSSITDYTSLKLN